MIKISASLLSSDFSNLEHEIKRCEKAGVDFLHLDIMDGNFVDNISFGLPILSSLRKKTNLIFDTHLMIFRPEFFIESFAKAGSDIITIHEEASKNIEQDLLLIKSFGKKAGISIKPNTDISKIEKFIDIVDLILIMTVEPGFSGQGFLDFAAKKIKQAKTLIEKSKRNIMLEVDGGVNQQTATMIKDFGADVLVSGSYLFSSKDDIEMKNKVEFLRK